MLPPAPTSLVTYNEIAVRYNSDLPALYNSLTLQEQTVVYYLFRASLPGNAIFTDQVHRNGIALQLFFEQLVQEFDRLKAADTTKPQSPLYQFPLSQFCTEAHTYLVYLWTNHGQYFQREHGDEKRTPSRLGLTTLTQKSLLLAATYLGIPNAAQTIAHLERTLFDTSYEPTTTEPNSIENSAVNIYEKGFTDADYANLSMEERNQLNAYFYVENNGSTRTPRTLAYAVGKKYDQEITTSCFWLNKALEVASAHPHEFDKNFTKSLQLLLQFLQTGDEEYFKQHSIAWLASTSKIDYNFGFIETYQDPKGSRGFFQAEATIKSVAIKTLNAILPALENQLPVPAAFKRDGLAEGTASIPNASINSKIFGTGALGPLFITAAYCLPNYEEIRSQYGSKQIIYPADKGIEQLLNPDLSRTLFNLKKKALWLAKNDPNGKLSNDIWDAQCILHETIGHASGKLATHTFVEGEATTIGETTYAVGDTIQVTNKNISEFLAGYESTIEELRAEIIALYISINHLEALKQCDLLTDWNTLLTDEELIDELILGMAGTGLRRLIQQSDTATEIAGDHARANCTIMYYLIDNGGLEISEEFVTLNNTSYTVIGLTIKDRAKTISLIAELMIIVQTIKSTGDGLGAAKLVNTYGKTLRNPSHMHTLKTNKRAVTGDIKVSCYVQPIMEPITGTDGKIIAIKATWPQSLDEQQFLYRKLALSTEYC